MCKLWEKIEEISHTLSRTCLQTDTSPKKNHRVEKDLIRFGVKLMVELLFEFKTFCIDNRQHILLNLKFW